MTVRWQQQQQRTVDDDNINALLAHNANHFFLNEYMRNEAYRSAESDFSNRNNDDSIVIPAVCFYTFFFSCYHYGCCWSRSSHTNSKRDSLHSYMVFNSSIAHAHIRNWSIFCYFFFLSLVSFILSPNAKSSKTHADWIGCDCFSKLLRIMFGWNVQFVCFFVDAVGRVPKKIIHRFGLVESHARMNARLHAITNLYCSKWFANISDAHFASLIIVWFCFKIDSISTNTQQPTID